MQQFKKLLGNDINPFRKDNTGKRPFDYASNLSFEYFCNDWIGALAFNMNPDLTPEYVDEIKHGNKLTLY
jgi:hypothetical protein